MMGKTSRDLPKFTPDSKLAQALSQTGLSLDFMLFSFGNEIGLNGLYQIILIDGKLNLKVVKPLKLNISSCSLAFFL